MDQVRGASSTGIVGSELLSATPDHFGSPDKRPEGLDSLLLSHIAIL